MSLPNAKEDYQRKTETKLKKIRTHIITLEKRIDKAEADIEVRYDQKMDQIRGQYAQAKEKLEELRESNQADWLDLQKGVDRAVNTLSEAVDIIARQISV